MQIIIAVLVLLFVVGYVVPNIIRYPWHTLVFIVVGIGLVFVMGGGDWLMARLKASQHPAARRYLAVHTTFVAILEGAPPYDAGRRWLVRTLVQGGFWIVMLATALALIVAMGGVFQWLDKQ